jgi:hypothetical protein
LEISFSNITGTKTPPLAILRKERRGKDRRGGEGQERREERGEEKRGEERGEERRGEEKGEKNRDI